MRRYRQGGVAGSAAPEERVWADSGRAKSSSGSLLAAPDQSRLLDIAITAVALVVLSPLIVLVALAVKLESRGPVFYRCERVGRGGRSFAMLKFRKMRDGVGNGTPLTAMHDDRLTRIGGLLAKTKIDEIPQLWNVVRGAMSLVGPRPEDRAFVQLHAEQYALILCVRPGITGLTQLAFVKEAEILAVNDRINDYVDRILPQKMRLDRLYVEKRSVRMDLQILAWTLAALVPRKDAAVHRETGRLSLRHRGRRRVAAVPADSRALAESPALADSVPGA